MRWFALILLPLSVFGSLIVPNPWNLKTGEVAVALGYPTLGIRYGVLDVAEVGFGLREGGAYFKLGYSTDSLGFGFGLSTYTFESAALFGSLGFKLGSVEISGGALYYETFASSPSYILMGEVFLNTKESGNMMGGIGAFGEYYPSENRFMGGIYASSTFEDVWIFEHVDLMGGVVIAHNLGEEFKLLKSLGVVFNLSTSFYLFRK